MIGCCVAVLIGALACSAETAEVQRSILGGLINQYEAAA
jgi:hypothetical protein